MLSFSISADTHVNIFSTLLQAVKVWNHKNVCFIAQLGDVIDGLNKQNEAGESALRTVFSILDGVAVPANLDHPFISSVIGNHELYNFERGALPSQITCASKSRISSNEGTFYSFKPFAGYRVVVLDAYDQGLIGWPGGLDNPKLRESLALIQPNNPNDVLGVSDWSKGLVGRNKRWMPFNGGVGPRQLAWLRSTLLEAEKDDERVIILTHVPICPGSASDVTLLWNYEEVLSVLQKRSGTVVAVFQGHDHEGGYHLDTTGIHHVTFESPLECTLDTVAFATVHVFGDRLEIEGAGKVPSRKLFFAPKKASVDTSARL